MASPRRCASTTVRSSLPQCSKIGVASAGSRVCLSSPASQIRTRLSSASTERIGTRCSIYTSSNRSSRCSCSPTNGSSATTTSGLTKVSAVCHRSSTCRDQQRSEILVIDCLLDGEAYARDLQAAQASGECRARVEDKAHEEGGSGPRHFFTQD